MLVLLLLLLLVMQLCQLPNGHMARRACIEALNEQPQNASRQVKSEEEEGKTGRHCADAMNSWRRGEFFKIATSHRTRARHEQPTLLLMHSSCCLPHAACLVPAWQSTHLFLCLCCCCCGWGLPLVIVVNYLCISKFIWNTKANALLCSARTALLARRCSALPWPGISFHGISNVVFSRIAHRASFRGCLLILCTVFLASLAPNGGAVGGTYAPCPAATYGHLNLPQPLSLSLLHIHTPSHFLGRAANNLCVFPWVWFIFPSAFQQLKQSAFLRAEAPRDVVVVLLVVVVQSSMLNVECWFEKGCLLLDTPDGWFRSIHLILYSILRHFTTFVYFDAGHEVFQLNHTLYG